jgi:hypothetical protein
MDGLGGSRLSSNNHISIQPGGSSNTNKNYGATFRRGQVDALDSPRPNAKLRRPFDYKNRLERDVKGRFDHAAQFRSGKTYQPDSTIAGLVVGRNACFWELRARK